MSDIKNIESEEEFEAALEASDILAVDFYADWCAPCKVIAPLLEDLNDILGERFTIVKVNIDQLPELTSSYNVRSIPTIHLFQNGEIINTHVGGATKPNLIKFFSAATNDEQK